MQTRIESSVKVVAQTHIELFDTLKAEWNALLEQSANNLIFLTWEWQSIWWNAYHPGDLWVLTVRDESDRLIGIAPWFISTEADERVVRCIGCEDVTDYLDVIVHADHVDTVYNCLADYLAAHNTQFDRLSLCNIPEEAITRTKFADALSAKGFAVEEVQQEVCPIIRLPQTWDDYLKDLGKKQRHEVRRKLRRIHGASGEINWYTVNAAHDLDAELTVFLRLMADSDPEKAAFLQDEQHVDFFKNFVKVAHERGWLKLSFLTIGAEPAAAYLNFDYQNQVLVYNSGLDFENFGDYSPGIVLLAYLIEEAIENKRTIFDFLRGNETYKYRMGGKDTGVFNLRARLAE